MRIAVGLSFLAIIKSITLSNVYLFSTFLGDKMNICGIQFHLKCVSDHLLKSEVV